MRLPPVTLILLAALLWCSGCGRERESEGENVQKLIPEFERRNPGIHVKMQAIPWTAAHEKLLTAYAGDATPDVAQLGNTWVPELSTLTALEDLSPWIARSQ